MYQCLFGFRFNGSDFLTYAKDNGHPFGVGTYFFNLIKKHVLENGIMDLNVKIKSIKFINNSDKFYTDLDLFNSQFYCHNSLLDSMLYTWIYIYDVDRGVFEIYQRIPFDSIHCRYAKMKLIKTIFIDDFMSKYSKYIVINILKPPLMK